MSYAQDPVVVLGWGAQFLMSYAQEPMVFLGGVGSSLS
jgi:hypothetical protein